MKSKLFPSENCEMWTKSIEEYEFTYICIAFHLSNFPISIKMKKFNQLNLDVGYMHDIELEQRFVRTTHIEIKPLNEWKGIYMINMSNRIIIYVWIFK